MRMTILSRLKQLCFCYVEIETDSAWISFEKSLQQLGELEHLEIGTLVMNSKLSINGERQLHLPNLHVPNLRVLCIHSLEGNYRITLDLPKLSKLLITCRFKSKFQLLNPTFVTHLALPSYYFSPYPDEIVQQFQECQYFYFTDWSFLYNQNFFNYLPKLKEIHCNTFGKIDILELIKGLNVSRMLNVRIYFNGFSAIDLDKVEELFGNDDRMVLKTQRIASNYHRLPRVVHIPVHLDYNELVRHFNSRLPTDLHTKLCNIRKLLVIGNVDDQADLLRFIRKLKPRNVYMEIKYTSLNQASYFYENLHLYWNRGDSLTIEENPGSITNLDFIIDLKNLSEFSTNQQMPYELIERLFNQRVDIDLEFFLNDQPIKIALNNYFHHLNKSHVQIAGQKYTYTNDDFLNGLRQIFGIYRYSAFP